MSEGKRAVIRKISRETGCSESSVYKILANPIGFSKATVDAVCRAAEAYGLRVGESARPSRTEVDALRIRVVLPARPLYFWREAVLGMEKSRERLEVERGMTVRLQYAYYNYPFVESECERLLSFSDEERPDALILFPTEQEACRRFLTRNESAEGIPVILFNDTQAYMTDAWFDSHPHIGFIGPDGYEEGVEAARLIRQCADELHRVAVVYSRQDHSAHTSDARVRGVCTFFGEESPQVEIVHVDLDPSENIAPATLARHLSDAYRDTVPDCVYISSGVTHVACAAVEKLERRRGEPLSTFVIGHECSAADKRYLLEGRQRGYIKQDVYTQGFEAVRDAVRCALGEATPARRLYRSSVFIR